MNNQTTTTTAQTVKILSCALCAKRFEMPREEYEERKPVFNCPACQLAQDEQDVLDALDALDAIVAGIKTASPRWTPAQQRAFQADPANFPYDMNCHACGVGFVHTAEEHAALIAQPVETDMRCGLCRAIAHHDALDHALALMAADFEECPDLLGGSIPTNEDMEAMAAEQLTDDDEPDYLQAVIDARVA